MIEGLLSGLSIPLVVGISLAVGLVLQIAIRLHYQFKFSKAGGYHASKLANNPISALQWLWTIGRAQASNRMLEMFNELYQYASPETPNLVEINVTGGQRYLFTRDPEHIKTVLTGKFAEFGKGDEFHRVWKPFLGDSIFTTDGKTWQDSRNLIRPMFIKNRVSDLKIFEKWTDVMIKQFPQNGEAINLQDYFYRLTIDIITEFLLGHSVNSLENPQSEFVKAFTDVQRWQTMLTVLMPIEKLVPRWQYLNGIKVLDNFVVPFINRTLALQPEELEKISKSDTEFTFLHALANYTRDPKVIRDQLIAVLLAGRDTTAATLSWAFYELSHAPVTYAKMRREVLKVVGPDREPTYEDIKNLKYVSHVLNETLRLYPAVPFNVRYALTDTSLPSHDPSLPDTTVVAGDAVFYGTIAMHRRDDLYPAPASDLAPAGVFSPDRWDKWQPKPWQYLPFNGGPRICIGQNFALTEMAYIMIRLVQRFERLEYRGNWDEQYHKVEIVGTPGQKITVALFGGKDQNNEKS